MSYHDYLPDTPYVDLPASAKTEIAAEEYEALRTVTAQLAAPPEMPAALAAAFAARTQAAGPKDIAKAPPSTPLRRWQLLAACGWGLLMAGVMAWWASGGSTSPVPSTRAPLPTASDTVWVHRTDTVVQTRVDTVTRVEVRQRVVRDTVYVPRPAPVAVAEREVPADAPAADVVESRPVSAGRDWRALTVRGEVGFGELR